jgi:RimJ/RimL family protein N-acetyltransferase
MSKEEICRSEDRVRAMQPGEERRLASIMRQCFGWFARLFFDTGKRAFVFERDGHMVGGITLSSFSIDASRRGGIVKWIFTVPMARGQGVAAELLSRAMEWFQAEGCTDLFASIEGYNTSSSRRFSQHGFERLSFSQQLRRYGWRIVIVWFRTMHVLDVGHFLWGRADPSASSDQADASPCASSGRPSGWAGFWATFLILTVLGYLMMMRQAVPLTVPVFWSVPLIIGTLLSARIGAMLLTARQLRLPVVYRPWETGLLLSGGIVLLFGGAFIPPGSVYPREQSWQYSALLSKLGPIALSGVASSLLLGWGLYVLDLIPLCECMSVLSSLGLVYVQTLLLFDVMTPFFPFDAFGGRRILDWNPRVWGLTAVGTLVLWLLAFLP